MAKIKVNIGNIKKTLRLILMLCALLSILNGISYQDVWGDASQELTQELAPVPTPRVVVSPVANETSVADTLGEVAGRIIPVKMAQVFFVIIIGMASIKLVLVVAAKVGLEVRQEEE